MRFSSSLKAYGHWGEGSDFRQIWFGQVDADAHHLGTGDKPEQGEVLVDGEGVTGLYYLIVADLS